MTTSFLALRHPASTQIPNNGVDTVVFMGVLTGSELYADDLSGSIFFLLARVFLFIAIGAGSFTVVMSCALSSFISPTDWNWKILGAFAGITAVIQTGVFFLYSTPPCTGSNQSCMLSNGSYYLILSTGCWMVVVVATAFLDPPRWGDELNAWRSKSHQQLRIERERHAQQHRAAAIGAHGQVADIEVDAESQAPLLKAPPRRVKKELHNGLQRWMGESQWAATAVLPTNQTDSLSQGDDEDYRVLENQIVPYYADNNISALELDILPNGRRPGDTGTSVASFDDLDSVVRMVEEGQLPLSNFLAPPSRNASFATNDEDSVLNYDLQHDVTERALVVADNTQKYAIKDVHTELDSSVPLDQVQTEKLATPVKGRMYQKPGRGSPEKLVSQDAQPSSETPTDQSTIAAKTSVIKNLTDNLKKRSRARRSKKNNYTLMDDADEASTLPVQEVYFQPNENGELPDVPGTPTRQAEFPCFNPRALSIMRKCRSKEQEEEEEYPDPGIAYMGSNDSTSEEEPDPIIRSTFSGDDFSDIVDRDFESVVSSSSSESSSSDEYQRPARRTRNRRRIGRTGSRGYSSVRSVVSSTSLLETFIAEETDADLHLEGVDNAPYDLVRSQSAPTGFPPLGKLRYASQTQKQQHIEDDYHVSVSSLGSALFPPATSISALDLYIETDDNNDSVLLSPIMAPRGPHTLGESTTVGSISKASASYDGTSVSDPPLDLSFDTEGEDPVDSISFSSEPPIDISGPLNPERDPPATHSDSMAAHFNYNTPKADPVSSHFDATKAAPRDWKDEDIAALSPVPGKFPSSASPATTVPETPSPIQTSLDRSFQSEQESNPRDLSISFESERSWKEEREIRGGIHAVPLDDLDESSSEDEMSRSTRSCVIVRAARIRRLQRETNSKRTRSCSTHRQRPSPSGSSGVDNLDLQLIEVMRPIGAEYGFDENSL